MLSEFEADVLRIFNMCQSTSGPGPGRVEVSGIILTPCFNQARLELYRAEIRANLNRLGDEFRKSNGGLSFLRAGSRLNTSLLVAEALIVLGIALGFVELTPRKDWSTLEGCRPIVYVLDDTPT